MNNYKFFQNKECEYFPCHEVGEDSNFNCLFCYCPLNPYKDCGGNYRLLDNGWKDCTDCVIPHYDYDYIISKLTELHYKGVI